jgi:tRNA A37 threonylcarbamoyladenosine dehydratase
MWAGQVGQVGQVGQTSRRFVCMCMAAWVVRSTDARQSRWTTGRMRLMSNDVAGSTVVVGAAGGLGRIMAGRLGRESGCGQLVVADIDAAGIDSLVAELREAGIDNVVDAGELIGV